MKNKVNENHPFFKRFSVIVKQKISSDGKSPLCMANEMSISKASFWRYVDSKAMPSIEILEKIADYFDVSTDWLLGRTDRRNYDE